MANPSELIARANGLHQQIANDVPQITVRAWALTDDDGKIVPEMCFRSKEDADYALYCLADGEALAGRVVLVEIRPIEEKRDD